MRAQRSEKPLLFEPYEWIVRETSWSEETNRNNETIFSVGNGYLGVRGFLEEADPRDSERSEIGTYINGVYEFHDFHHIWRRPGFPARFHSVTNQANPFRLKLMHAGETLSPEGKVGAYERVLDMRDGTVRRSFTYTFGDRKTVDVLFERFASQTSKHALHMRVTVTAREETELTFESLLEGLPPDRCSDACSAYLSEEVGTCGDSMFVRYRTKRSGIGICCAMSDLLNVAATAEVTVGAHAVRKRATAVLRAGVPTVYERTVVYTTSLDDGDEKEVALSVLGEQSARGYERALRETARSWEAFWENADVSIEGDTAVQQGMRFALFMLRQSCGTDGKTNISANGLTGSGYEGWTFWDTEIFMLPVFLYTCPEVARKLLESRYLLLEKAKERAKEVDGAKTRGALYAWQTINGEECAHLYECAPGQIHIDPDICYAIERYLEATDDFSFIEDYGAEILFETSIYMVGRGFFSPMKGGKFCFNVVCGPDEYSPAVDNNTYTNWMTRRQFRFTLSMYDRMKREAPEKLRALEEKCGFDREIREKIRRAADRMYIGYSEESGVYTQDDQFLYRDPIDLDAIPKEKLPLLFSMHPLNLWRFQVCKQADLVLLVYLCSEDFTEEEKRRIFEFYEPKTIHDSSLSAGIHSIVACDIGNRSEAYGYLRQSARMDLDNINGNTYFGVHAANMGNTYQILVNGFAGMRPKDGTLTFRPYLPPEWSGYAFNVHWKGRVIRVSVRREGADFRLMAGEPIEIVSDGRPITVGGDA